MNKLYIKLILLLLLLFTHSYAGASDISAPYDMDLQVDMTQYEDAILLNLDSSTVYANLTTAILACEIKKYVVWATILERTFGSHNAAYIMKDLHENVMPVNKLARNRDYHIRNCPLTTEYYRILSIILDMPESYFKIRKDDYINYDSREFKIADLMPLE